MAPLPGTSNTGPPILFTFNATNSRIPIASETSMYCVFDRTTSSNAVTSVEATTAAKARRMASNLKTPVDPLPPATTALGLSTSCTQDNSGAPRCLPTDIASMFNTSSEAVDACVIATTTATHAASGCGSVASARQRSCMGIPFSPALQAAAAVPVVVAVLATMTVLFFCILRRWKHWRAGEAAKRSPEKKWTRHLRLFAFDAELLADGRLSSTNSIRNEDRVRSGQNTVHSALPWRQSVEDVVPRCHCAMSSVQPAQTRSSLLSSAGLRAMAATQDHIQEYSTTATAPPTYAVATGETPRCPDSQSR